MTNTDYCEVCLAEVRVPPWFNEKVNGAFCSKSCHVIDVLLKERFSEHVVKALGHYYTVPTKL